MQKKGVSSSLRVTNLEIFHFMSLLVHFIHAATQFTIEPGNVTVALSQMQTLTFQCSVSDESLMQFWTLKFLDVTTNLSTRDSNDMPVLDQRGVTYNSRSVTIPGVAENNCTLIRCVVLRFTTVSTTEFSDPVKLTIVGKRNNSIV